VTLHRERQIEGRRGLVPQTAGRGQATSGKADEDTLDLTNGVTPGVGSVYRLLPPIKHLSEGTRRNAGA
jgi:hypothetical protein